MRIAVHAVGRMKSGPEKELAERYLERLARSGPAIGLEFAGVEESAESRLATAAARRHEESRRLDAALASGAVLVLLDERGKSVDSEQFAENLGGWRDSGRKSLIVAIGGPDGHDPALRARADMLLAFGAMTWPHQLVRIMVAEQLYRAATILSGHPYHRA